MWSVEGVITREQRRRKTRGRVSWRKSSCVTCGVEVVKRHEIGEIEKQKKEE